MFLARTTLLLSVFALAGNLPAGSPPLTAHGASAAAIAIPIEIPRANPPTSVLPCAQLDVHTQLDRSRLAARGQAAMRLVVRGTREPVRLRLINDTPGVVSLEGGDVQLAVTSGGPDNRLERVLSTHRAGRFEIRWELPEAGCGMNG